MRRPHRNEQIILSYPKVMMGKPVIVGTRIAVELILEKLAAGETVDQLLEQYPRLTPQSISAALEFAARALKADVVYDEKGPGRFRKSDQTLC